VFVSVFISYSSELHADDSKDTVFWGVYVPDRCVCVCVCVCVCIR